MAQKERKNSMSKRTILKWSKEIRPIVKHNGFLEYLRPLTKKEVLSIWYTSLKKDNDYGERVDFSEISLLTDVKMSGGCVARPCVAEIIEQIPKELLPKVVAFYMVYSQVYSDNRFFNKEEAVIIVRLFQAKDETVGRAKNIRNYPQDSNITPIGMTDDEFKKFKKFKAQRV